MMHLNILQQLSPVYCLHYDLLLEVGDHMYKVNYMFYHTYENIDRIIVGVHVDTQEELDEMKRDRDFVLNSGKLDYEDAFRDE